MNSLIKKVGIIIAALVGFLVIGRGLTGCNFFDSDGGAQQSSSSGGTEIPGLPPDPGEAGKQTLTGIESDNDGVRDDVQIAIYKRYPNDELKRSALTQGAKALQDAILAGAAILSGTSDSNEPFRVSGKIDLVVLCFGERFADRDYEEIGFLESTLVNTRIRGDAYVAYNSAVSNQSLGLPDVDIPCQ